MQSLTDVVLASPLAKELDRAGAEALAGILKSRELADGEVLLPEGARDSHLHVILDGRISVARRAESGGGWNVLYSLGRGDLVGELSFMDDEPRYAALVASGPTRVLVLDRTDFERLLATHPQVVYRVMRAIMRVAHDVQRRLSRQMLELQNYLYRPGAKY